MSARGVTIQLDVPRKIRFDGEALLALEEITGMTVLEVCRTFKGDEEDSGKTEEQQAEDRAARFSFKLICQVTQAGLTGELPRASTRDIVKLMEENGKGEGAIGKILSYTTDVFEALSQSIGGKEVKNADDDEKLERWDWETYERLGYRLGLKPWELWKFTPRELNRFAREKRIEINEESIRTRYETAIICAYTVNSSGTVKVGKSPDDIYRKMKIKTIEEQESATDEMGGERRFYKGSLSSQFQQHAEWLESQK
jgi:hypothetical protein